MTNFERIKGLDTEYIKTNYKSLNKLLKPEDYKICNKCFLIHNILKYNLKYPSSIKNRNLRPECKICQASRQKIIYNSRKNNIYHCDSCNMDILLKNKYGHLRTKSHILSLQI